ncbi:MAG: hypothetical protein K0U98_05420 [Deltaproteobacteria bacterium]|nr:hypothetical protein [Deltaproteobacteria bacterium]
MPATKTFRSDARLRPWVGLGRQARRVKTLASSPLLSSSTSSQRIVAVLLALASVLATSTVAAHIYPFTTLSVEDGLAQSVVRDILEDSRGFLWLATAGGGLSRWDGASFATVSSADGLPSDRINALEEDQQGRLWVATEQGLAVFDGRLVTTYPKTADLDILDLQEDPQGVLWLATRTGIYSIAPLEATAATEASPQRLSPEESPGESQRVNAVTLDGQGQPWFGGDAGLQRFANGELQVVEGPEGPEKRIVRSLFKDRQGSLWIGFQEGGAARHDGQHLTYLGPDQGIPPSPVRGFAEDSRGRLWIGTEEQGVVLWAENGTKTTLLQRRNGLPGNGVIALAGSSSGNVWLSTFGEGFSRLTTEAFTLFTASSGEPGSDEPDRESLEGGPLAGTALPGNKVLSITEDREGTLWIGVLEGGLVRLDESGFTTFGTAQGLRSPLVTSVLADSRGGVWVTTINAGVSFFDGHQFRNFDSRDGLAHNSVFSAFQDRQGVLWFSTWGGGVSRYDGETFVTLDVAQGLAGNKVYSTFEDRQGNLWFATSDGGVSRYDGHQFENFTENRGLASHRVYAVRQDPAGRIWMATDKGLCRLDGDHFSHFGLAQGLGSVSQYSLLVDGRGDLWAGGEKGLDRIELGPDGGLAEVRHYGPREGFLGGEGNQNAVFEDSQGRIWFGAKGLTRYDPTLDHLPTAPPRMHLSDLQVHFHELDWRHKSDDLSPWFGLPKNLRLPFKENHLTIGYVATNAGSPVRYQYRLAGLTEAWSPPSSQRQATFSHLPPGEFRFEARASYDGESWSDPATLPVLILPPFWKTSWFVVLALMTTCLLLGLILRSRTAFLRRRQQQLEEEVSLRTQQLQLAKEAAEMASVTKSQFLANMTHELRTPLAGMIGMTHLLRKTELSDQQKSYTDRIQNSGSSLLSIVNDLLEASRLGSQKFELQESPIRVETLLAEACGAVAVEVSAKGLELSHSIAPEVPAWILSDETRLRQILLHLVTNAVKFTDQGKIRMEAQVVASQEPGLHLEIRISDTGLGVPENKLYQLFEPFFQVDASLSRRQGGTGLGLSICDHLAKQLGGSIRAESKLGEGSNFFLTFPTSPSAPPSS